MVQVLHSTQPVARKIHHCDDCGRAIEKGEKYERQDNVFDGSRYAWKFCGHCAVIASWIWRTQDTTYFDEGLNVGEWLHEYSRDSLTAFRANFYYRKQWRQGDGTLVPVARITTPSVPLPNQKDE